ncbi:neudesin-like [Actinia tenebrosa]|uniref:Neudesin-like n=1 Tax=Actinia tenebrosa TaxID=6105 RepID=A0A6P8I5L0_ACTTE|nr:neudesin-like [Actinia tenebrosa]
MAAPSLVLVIVAVSCCIGVQVKDKAPHAPFSDLHENLSTESGHRLFSLEELSSYNGQNSELPIYVAVKGVVFDVTQGKDYYGVGKPYNVFTGKDASRAIAKWSMDPKDMIPELDGLTKEEFDRLEDNFENVYMKKYPAVGYVRGYEPRPEEDNLIWSRQEL